MLFIILAAEWRRRACAETWAEAGPSPTTCASCLHHPEQFPPHRTALSHSGGCCQLIIPRAQLLFVWQEEAQLARLPPPAPPFTPLCPSATANMRSAWSLPCRQSSKARGVPQSCCPSSHRNPPQGRNLLSQVTTPPRDPLPPKVSPAGPHTPREQEKRSPGGRRE